MVDYLKWLLTVLTRNMILLGDDFEAGIFFQKNAFSDDQSGRGPWTDTNGIR